MGLRFPPQVGSVPLTRNLSGIPSLFQNLWTLISGAIPHVVPLHLECLSSFLLDPSGPWAEYPESQSLVMVESELPGVIQILGNPKLIL